MSLSHCQAPFCPGEGPDSPLSTHPYSPALGGVHSPGSVSLGPLAWSPLRLRPWETAERQGNRWGPAKGAAVKGLRRMLAAKGAEPERALQGLLTKVGTFPGQELLLEQPWVLENFSP